MVVREGLLNLPRHRVRGSQSWNGPQFGGAGKPIVFWAFKSGGLHKVETDANSSRYCDLYATVAVKIAFDLTSSDNRKELLLHSALGTRTPSRSTFGLSRI